MKCQAFRLTAALSLAAMPASFAGADFPGFERPVNYWFPDSSDIVAVDINDDGALDLLGVYVFGLDGSKMLNNGDGTFKQQENLDTPPGATSIAAGDLDGDGQPDIAVSGGRNDWADFGWIATIRSNNDGTFLPAQELYNSDKMGSPGGIDIGDLNNDGINDVVVVGWLEERVLIVCMGTGNGTFAPPELHPAGEHASHVWLRPSPLQLVDLNDDGDLDALVAYSNSNVVVYLGNGDGTFQPSQTYDSGPSSVDFSLGDIDHDGDLDLAVANFHFADKPDGLLSVLAGNGDGSFQPPDGYATGFGTMAVAIGDIDGDGHPDIAANFYRTSGVGIHFGNGLGQFGPAQYYGRGSEQLGLVVADLNNGGAPDIVVGADGDVTVLLNLNDQTTGIGDLNGDGTVDVTDLLMLLTSWGPCSSSCPSDLNDDATVDVSDLLILLGAWS